MATIRVDGREHGVDPSRNLLAVCLELGYDLPYFCWHPALGSVGACRQCAVKQFQGPDDERGRIVMACMTPAADGTIISLKDADATDFRARVIEWLMVNHPHDCPVCDEGGECHLQDMTVMTGHTYRDFRFDKRTYRNQDLGPLVNHEMNRCIQCYRCVRFYDDYAGGGDLQAMAAHDHVYFGRHEDGTLESPFAGNLVEVCPTGVFTDKTLKNHYTRKWDLSTAPSVCQQCGLGCTTTPGERYGELRRVRARYHGKVNGYFLCDRGRYGYEYVNDERRIRTALAPQGPERQAAALEADEALERAAGIVRDLGSGRVLGIGSPRASLEANFALRRLVGAESFYRGVPAREARLTDHLVGLLSASGARTPSLRETEDADAVLVLGEDVTNTAPMLALALRQALRTVTQKTAEAAKVPLWLDQAVRELATLEPASPLWIATPMRTDLDRDARWAGRLAPEDVARMGFAIAEAVTESRSGSGSGGPEQKGGRTLSVLSDQLRARAREIAEGLLAAERPLVVSGTSLDSAEVLEATRAVIRALVQARTEPPDLFLVVPEPNSVGLALLGGRSLDEALDRLESGAADGVVILENDLVRRAPRDRVARALASVRVVVLDHLAHDTAALAEVVFPAATFAEADGTSVNNEGRAQRFTRVMEPQAPVRASWRWLRDLGRAAGRKDLAWQRLSDVVTDMESTVPALARVGRAAPEDRRRLKGARVPRESHRYSGRTAMGAHRNVVEPRPPRDEDAPYSFSMEGLPGRPPGALASEFWAPGWNSIQALNRFQEEIAGPLRGGDGGVRLIDGAGGTLGAPTPGSAAVPVSDAHERPAFSASDSATDAREQSQGAADGPTRSDVWRAVPIHHCFGSEWTSALAGGVAELTPEAYVALGADEAHGLELADGEAVEVELEDGRSVVLTVRLEPEFPSRCLGMPWGLPGLESGERRDWIRIRRNGSTLVPARGGAER